MVVSTAIFSQYKASASPKPKKGRNEWESSAKCGHLQSSKHVCSKCFLRVKMIPVFWLKSTSASYTRAVQRHFFSFLATIQLPATLLSWTIRTYLGFLLPILVLTWPWPPNRVPKPKSRLSHKLLSTVQDFPDSIVQMHMCIVKNLLWMQTFLKPLMTAIESGTASADATLLTCISHYCNKQLVYRL